MRGSQPVESSGHTIRSSSVPFSVAVSTVLRVTARWLSKTSSGMVKEIGSISSIEPWIAAMAMVGRSLGARFCGYGTTTVASTAATAIAQGQTPENPIRPRRRRPSRDSAPNSSSWPSSATTSESPAIPIQGARFSSGASARAKALAPQDRPPQGAELRRVSTPTQSAATKTAVLMHSPRRTITVRASRPNSTM